MKTHELIEKILLGSAKSGNWGHQGAPGIGGSSAKGAGGGGSPFGGFTRDNVYGVSGKPGEKLEIELKSGEKQTFTGDQATQVLDWWMKDAKGNSFTPLPKGQRIGASQRSLRMAREIGKDIEGSIPVIRTGSAVSGTKADFITKKSIPEVEGILSGKGYSQTDAGYVHPTGKYRVEVRDSTRILYPGTEVVVEAGA